MSPCANTFINSAWDIPEGIHGGGLPVWLSTKRIGEWGTRARVPITAAAWCTRNVELLCQIATIPIDRVPLGPQAVSKV